MLSTLSRQSISKLSHLTVNNGRNIQRTVSTFKNVSLRDVRRSATQKPKRDFNSLSGRRLDRMEDAANLDPHNAQKQADFLHELNKLDPNAVIQRFESNLFSSNEACLKEYISALAKVERLDKVMPQITSSIAKATPTGTSTLTPSAQKAFNQAAISSINMGTSNEPLHVVMQEPGIKAQMWKTLRTITLAFLLITGLSTLVEDKGLSRGMAVHNEVEPNSSNSNYKFADVQGVDEAKAELEEIVDYLKDPGKFTRLGGKLPKGVLLVGPPGTGKTLLARAIAGEAGVPFFYASGSEFDEMFVGVGARRIRELFAAAKRKAPCIIFIDEIDAIGGSRNPKDQQFVRMTLNQLLVELDGFNQTEGVIVIAATNFPESLDKALTRPGRFDRNVVVPLPDVRGREQILKVHAKSVPLSKDADLQVIARGTPGFSGADLQNLINQGALRASLEGKAEVSMNHLEYARDKIIMGAERKSAVIEQENRKIVAFHEGGHALVALYTPGALPIHKATIMPRGQALGMVAQLPEKDELSWTKKQLYARLDVAMGGRAAEEMIFGTENVTSGASSDIEQATRIATAIVTKFGMSPKVGPVLHKEEDMSHLSPETRFLIESEIKTILEDAKQRAETILKTHKDELHRLANALLDYETLTKDEIEKVITGKTFDREKVKKSQPVTTTKQDTPAAPLLLSESDKK